jgi:hypothetical protein
MARLSISQAWDETAEILRRDFGPFLAVALALIAVPDFAVQVLAAGPIARAGATAAPLALPLFLVALVPVCAATLALSALALGRERVVGAAIAYGFRRCPSLIGAVLLLFLGAFLILIPLVAASGVTPEQLAARTPEAVRRSAFVLATATILFVLIGVKLLLVAPATAAEAIGPIAALRRSWRLTGGHFWKLLGFNLLVSIAYGVLILAISAVVGILVTMIAGRPEPGNASALILQLVGAFAGATFVMVLAIMMARIYLQLAGGGAPTTGS